MDYKLDQDKLLKITNFIKESMIRFHYEEISREQMDQALKEFADFWIGVKEDNNIQDIVELTLEAPLRKEDSVILLTVTI